MTIREKLCRIGMISLFTALIAFALFCGLMSGLDKRRRLNDDGGGNRGIPWAQNPGNPMNPASPLYIGRPRMR